MPISRRNSLAALDPNHESGVYPSALGTRLDELDEAFEDDFPDLPSLLPGTLDLRETKAALPKELEVPDLVFDGPARKNPMFRTSSSANIAAVRAPAPSPMHAPELDFASEPPPARAPELRLDSPLRTSSADNMAAVRPAPAGPPVSMGESRGFDSFDEDNVDIALDIKTVPKNQAAAVSMSGNDMVPSSAGAPTPISSTQKAHDPRPGIVAFAGYGIPPTSIGAMPGYALRVLVRKMTLRDDLRIARMRRIQDVSLYEAALACADESAVTKGIALIAGTLIGGVSAVVAAATFLL